MLDFGFYNQDCIQGMKQMPDDSVDLTLTDIPYDGVNNAREGGGIRVIKKGDADILTFDLDIFLQEVYRVTKGTIIIFCGQNQVSPIYSALINYARSTVRQLIWEKTNPSPMNGQLIYLSGIENAIWCKKSGGYLTHSVKTRFSVFRQDLPSFILRKRTMSYWLS